MFGDIPYIGVIFPTFVVDIAELNGFFSTGEQIITLPSGDQETVYPGLSLFVGSEGIGGFIQDIFKFILEFVGGILVGPIDSTLY